MARRIAIAGAGALGAQMAEHLTASGRYEIAGWFDDAHPEGHELHGHRVLGPFDAIEACRERFDALQLGLGDHQLVARSALWERIGDTVPLETFVGPGSWVADSVRLGPGCFVFPGATLDIRCALGPVNVVHVGCTFAHDARFGTGNFVGPGVTLSGFVEVGNRNLLGVGSTARIRPRKQR